MTSLIVLGKQITKKSGFFSKVSMGDCVLANRGFNIKEELSALTSTLKIQSFTKAKKQLSGGEVDTSRQLSIVRIDEEYIGRIKKL